MTQASHPVLQAEAKRLAAMRANDTQALAPLLHEGIVYLHSSGGTDSKESVLAKLKSGQLRYLRVDFEDLAVADMGCAAVVTGRMVATVHREGKDLDIRSQFMTVWQARDPLSDDPAGEPWRLRAHQGTPIK